MREGQDDILPTLNSAQYNITQLSGNQSVSISIPIPDNEIDESNRTITVNLEPGSYYSLC